MSIPENSSEKNPGQPDSLGMSRRRFLGVSLGTLVAGAFASMAMAPSLVFASSSATPAQETSSGSSTPGWRIVLHDGYPYPDALRKYAARAVFETKEQALKKIRGREYPLSIRWVE